MISTILSNYGDGCGIAIIYWEIEKGESKWNIPWSILNTRILFYYSNFTGYFMAYKVTSFNMFGYSKIRI